MKKNPAAASPSRDESTVEMFPELLAQIPPAKPAPLSAAVRQKRRRERKKLEGLKDVALSPAERLALVEAIQVLDLVRDPHSTPAERQSLVRKLAPDDEWLAGNLTRQSWRGAVAFDPGRPLEADPLEFSLQLSRFDLSYLWWAVDVFNTARNDLNHRESRAVRASLLRIFRDMPGFSPEQLDTLGADGAVLITEKRHLAERARAWKAYEELQQRWSGLQAELASARAEIAGLKATLKQIAQEVAGE